MTSSAPTQPYLMWINEHPDFHQWLTETFEIIDDQKTQNQASYILYQSRKAIVFQLKINFLQQSLLFSKWKLKTILHKNIQSLLKKILTTPNSLQLLRLALCK